MTKIKNIISREILDSRGIPTVETKITLDNDLFVKSSAPSGTSLGKYEAVELRDDDPDRYLGKGVLKAVANINQIIGPELLGTDPTNQEKIDMLLTKLDGTENKSKLGANALISVSQTVCKAGALCRKIPVYLYLADLAKIKKENLKIPQPIFNLINGGKHGAGNLDFQEFHVIPQFDGSFSESLETGGEIYLILKQVLIRHKAIHSVGDEGGFAPNLFTNADALEILEEAIREAGLANGRRVFLGLDVAASHFFQGGRYKIRDRTMPMETEDFVNFYMDLAKAYPFAYIEDPFFEDDWEGWTRLKASLKNIVIVGDDLLATNQKRVEKAIKQEACSALLAKPNQVGTVWETMRVIKTAQKAGWKIIVSHRSGETNDDFIADFAVGVGADLVKFGAPARGERVAKYNRLLVIEKELKTDA